MSLSKYDVLAAKLRREEIDVPELGGTVLVRCFTGTERDWFERNIQDKTALSIRSHVARFVCLNPDGSAMFSEGDLEAIGGIDGQALDRILEAAMRLSLISGQSVEDAEKNSEGGRSASGGSDSPQSSGAQ